MKKFIQRHGLECGHLGLAIGGAGGLVLLAACAGPIPLDLAIRESDQDAYAAALNANNGDARKAFAEWMAEERGVTVTEVLGADQAMSPSRNPFDAHRDLTAVSHGAVLYRFHCARCHGEHADGQGPSALADHPATSFKSFGKRLGATLHRGAPRKWSRVILNGSGEVVTYPEGPSTAMPAYGDQLTREQVWLLVTYLQSLDMHASRGGAGRR